MTWNRNGSRWSAAGLALVAALTLGGCGDDSQNDVTNDPVDDRSSTAPEEQDQGGEEDRGGEVDDN
ncbi:hypothetical protein [Nocardioides sp. SYSU DS0651]|uniref:hypothetical protein n=1 Tax=Nocardioides sp. SYSU DS0651 TaxID=3415955 RepID=UPI003F4C5E94